MKNKVLSKVFEIIGYVVAGLLGGWALAYIALGIACEFVRYDTGIAYANRRLNLGFLWEGLIILAAAVVLALIVLLITAKKSDRDFEKAQRRAARLRNKPTAEENNPEVVDAEVAPVEEKKEEE